MYLKRGNISSRELTYPPDKAYLKMIFLFLRWDMLISWRVSMIQPTQVLYNFWNLYRGFFSETQSFLGWQCSLSFWDEGNSNIESFWNIPVKLRPLRKQNGYWNKISLFLLGRKVFFFKGEPSVLRSGHIWTVLAILRVTLFGMVFCYFQMDFLQGWIMSRV